MKLNPTRAVQMPVLPVTNYSMTVCGRYFGSENVVIAVISQVKCACPPPPPLISIIMWQGYSWHYSETMTWV
jgi:hypothetical protein